MCITPDITAVAMISFESEWINEMKQTFTLFTNFFMYLHRSSVLSKNIVATKRDQLQHGIPDDAKQIQ